MIVLFIVLRPRLDDLHGTTDGDDEDADDGKETTR